MPVYSIQHLHMEAQGSHISPHDAVTPLVRLCESISGRVWNFRSMHCCVNLQWAEVNSTTIFSWSTMHWPEAPRGSLRHFVGHQHQPARLGSHQQGTKTHPAQPRLLHRSDTFQMSQSYHVSTVILHSQHVLRIEQLTLLHCNQMFPEMTLKVGNFPTQRLQRELLGNRAEQ